MLWLIGILFIFLSLAILAILLKVSAQINEQLGRMNNTLQESNRAIGQNLGNATHIFGNVQEKLGRLEETNRQIYEVGRDIASLQDLLRAPKFRGAMGETLLENILSQVLPKGYYFLQHRFKSGETVDAAIKLGERLVPIDAKFTLENFQKMLQAENEQEKESYRRKFAQDIKGRADEIALRYILPQEDTYDFALMYIPAENIYYEVVIREELLSYSLSKRVIPVSPNTFYAYLQVICLGLKGLQVEENAKLILKSLSALSLELGKFKEEFVVLGRHLSDASSKYEDAEKRLNRFSDRLNNIQDDSKI